MNYEARCALYRKEAQVWYEMLHGDHSAHVYDWIISTRKTIPENPWK